MDGRGAGKWTINRFVCKFIYKKYTSSRLLYWLTNLYILQIQNMYLHVYVCTTSTLHGFEKQRQHENALFLWARCHDTAQWLVQLLCEQGQSQCDTRGHSGASSAVVSLFFNLQCAGTAGWGRSLRPPSFFAIVLHAGDGISQLTQVSWKKKKKTKKKRRKRLAAAFKAALSTALSSEVTFSRQRWSSGNLLSAPPPSMFSGLCQGSSQNTSSWTPGGFS